MKKYVQHISGQGKKWELRECRYNENNNKETWVINDGMELPRSEFKPCDPPEEWEDVTDACEIDSYSNAAGEFYSILHLGGLHLISADGKPRGGDCNVMYKKYGYRLRKIDHLHNGPCFIVERKKS